MKICPSCGHENADDARFCSQCATPLDSATAAREERKVVTCLFCDLVGFTARAERMDPEDVRRLLQPYHTRVRAELERFGGTVEKFIGDAVMAVFGAPVAHEDDPERAVRAALSIRDTLTEEGELEVRIGITTGEALVALGARPDAGEGMASGDVVNTAARIQTAAPAGEILVDETTFRATERVVEYREAGAFSAKGKLRPVPVWGAVRARAHVGVERLSTTPFVGRAAELGLLQETLTRVVRERQPQLVTLVGEPGIGKSRLVLELFEAIRTGDFGLVLWRHGRSLPYGEGVTFWALAEIVKAQTGILESDAVEHAKDKLRHAVGSLFSDAPDADWIERQLRPLAGLEADTTGTGDTRGEAFAAWRRFLEALAETRPLVLVFDDLQWADDAQLDFVDYLVDWARGVPLLALCTARPELLVRRPGWGGGKVNSSTILLSALSEDETSELVGSLVTDAEIAADVRAKLLERASGNPLYAEEFTRLVTVRRGETTLPESVQGIIAARLDTLPQEEKELLQEAAVMGRVFWLGALGRERWALEERLHSLDRKEFVARERRSSVAGEEEYVFRHALVRDVAYEQIPKAERAEKHRAAAEWIESLGRSEDHAELLAHHYASAIDYARASGGDVGDLSERGRLVLREAGDRAFALSAFAAAARYYEVAVELWPHDDLQRAGLLLDLARAYHVSGDERRGPALEAAREELHAAGHVERAAEADALLAEVWWYRRERGRCDELLERAATSVADLPDSPAKAFVLSQVARYRMLADQMDEALQIGQEALEMAERLGLDELRAHALVNIGTARANSGDPEGVTILERGAELGLALRSAEGPRALNNLSSVHASFGDFKRQEELLRDAVRAGEELGTLSIVNFARATLAGNLFWIGKWDEGFQLAEEWLAESHQASAELGLRRNRARALLARDDIDGALEDITVAVEGSRQIHEPQALLPGLGAAVRIYLELGREAEARELMDEVLDYARGSSDWRILDLSFAAEPLGFADVLRPRVEQLRHPTMGAANLALIDGDFEHAADLIEGMGMLFAAADARRLAATKFEREDRLREAEAQLRLALAFYRPVRATRYVRACEALLLEVSEVSA